MKTFAYAQSDFWCQALFMKMHERLPPIYLNPHLSLASSVDASRWELPGFLPSIHFKYVGLSVCRSVGIGKERRGKSDQRGFTTKKLWLGTL